MAISYEFCFFGAIEAKHVPKSKNGEFRVKSPKTSLLQKFDVFQKLKIRL
jgi:hypothetical protein